MGREKPTPCTMNRWCVSVAASSVPPNCSTAAVDLRKAPSWRAIIRTIWSAMGHRQLVYPATYSSYVTLRSCLNSRHPRSCPPHFRSGRLCVLAWERPSQPQRSLPPRYLGEDPSQDAFATFVEAAACPGRSTMVESFDQLLGLRLIHAKSSVCARALRLRVCI